MDKQQEKSFEFAKETVTRLTGLSSGIIALTVTFSKQFAPEAEGLTLFLLAASWLSLFASVFFGVWALLAMTGVLGGGRGEREASEPASVYAGSISIPTAIQILAFVLGLGLTVAFGILSLVSGSGAVQAPPAVDVPT